MTACRHRRAWPSILRGGYGAGYFWCPDCGAIRTTLTVGVAEYRWTQSRWLRPGEHYERDMAAIQAADRRTKETKEKKA